MEKREAKELLKKYDAGNCTAYEKALLESWYLNWQAGEFDLNDEELKLIKDQTYRQLITSRQKEHRFFYWKKYAAAAAVFAVLAAGLLVYQHIRPAPTNTGLKTVQSNKDDAAPGANKALLTLADGSIVQLDAAGTGKIREVAGVTIRKTADGQVIYETAPSPGDDYNESGNLQYNRISTPRGGQYKIILPDGTKVWLNAASSLKYPVKFTKKIRSVELTGEGYFEVSKQHSSEGNRIPFFVTTATQIVEVLGTHFNINAYSDEKTVLTTLLEGAVKVSVNTSGKRTEADLNRQVVLKPGQQAALTVKTLNVKAIDTEEFVAWKNGYFSFEQADLPAVMRQLSRWYDVEVVYIGSIPSERFTGKVYRNMSLSKVLDILSYTLVNFKLEGKKLIITP